MLHYTTLHHATLHYTTLHCTTLHYTLYTSIYTIYTIYSIYSIYSTYTIYAIYTTLTTLTTTTTLITYTTLRYATLHHTTLQLHYCCSCSYNYASLHYTTLDYSTLPYITLHYIHYTTTDARCTCTTLTTLHHNYNSMTLKLQQLHYTTLHPAVVGEVIQQVTIATIATFSKKRKNSNHLSVYQPSVTPSNQALL